MFFRNEIELKLLHLFESKKCVILDIPAYPNVGDQLIWVGMETFFEKNAIRCLYRTSCETFTYRELSTDTVICLVGGGNFGDLWRGLQEFKNRIVQSYPNNKIVVFPQSVHYSSMELCKIDSDIFAKHHDIAICARDEESYAFLQKYFKNFILLVPDMVLYLSFNESFITQKHQILFLQRKDKEMVDYTKWIRDNMVISDWPTHNDINPMYVDAFMKQYRLAHRIFRHSINYIKNDVYLMKYYELCFHRMLRRVKSDCVASVDKWKMIYIEINYLMYLNKKYQGRLNEIINSILYAYHLPLITKYAIEFMRDYDEVYTTRLHGGILAMLLGKKVWLIDNNYGKISALYKTWLANESNVQMID